MKRKYDMRKSI